MTLKGLQFKDILLPVKSSHSIRFTCQEYQTSGKGLTHEQCKASAIMEFVERYSWLNFEYKTNSGYTVASFKEIVKDKHTVEPSYFLSNFFALENKNQLIDKITSLPMKWIEGISLNNGKPFFYPINWHNYVFATNGLAAGNVMEEAILQAICELVERENTFRLFALCEPANTVDPASISHPMISRLLNEAKDGKIEFLIKDISYDMGIPTFIVCGIIASDIGLPTHMGVGHGCHLDPNKALIRALSEYFEGLSSIQNMMKGLKREINWKESLSKQPAFHGGFIVTLNFQMLEKSLKTIKINDMPNLSNEDIGEELRLILNILASHGHEVILINKTHPIICIPAVRIFAPKMRTVLNAEIHSPFRAMSGICYEAYDDKSADEFIKQFNFDLARLSANLPMLFNSLLLEPSASSFFSRNYQTSLLNIMRNRKRLM
ncbi:MAG: YcaO-like family protein [Desulfobacterales bacterium]|nr:YcaO-like family protein [Desulfobacterales bacterium]